MSHNASATSPVINLNNYSNFVNARSPSVKCYYSDNTSGSECVGNYFSSVDESVNKLITGFDMSPSFPNGQDFKANDVVEFDLTFYSTSTLSDTFRFGVISNLSQSSNFILISWEEIQNNSYLDVENGGYSFVVSYHFVFFARSNISSSIFSISSSGSRPFTLYDGSASFGGYRLVLTNYLCWRKNDDSASQDQQNEINATNDAVDESEDAGSSSSSSASEGGANLLSAITGFFNVITSAQPSNCNFSAPLNTYFGNQRLNVDLCALDLPSGIGSLTSLIAIGILIPFAIHMFNKFINLFRSFQS